MTWSISQDTGGANVIINLVILNVLLLFKKNAKSQQENQRYTANLAKENCTKTGRSAWTNAGQTYLQGSYTYFHHMNFEMVINQEAENA